jgi:hypothetical protein
MVGKRSGQAGYVALIAVLVIGAAAAAISLVLLTTGVDSQRTALTDQRSKQSRALAIACAHEALQQIHDATGFTGSNNLSLGSGSCTYTVTSTGASTRTVTASGTVGDVVRKVQAYVTINASSISVTSWQEVS